MTTSQLAIRLSETPTVLGVSELGIDELRLLVERCLPWARFGARVVLSNPRWSEDLRHEAGEFLMAVSCDEDSA